MSVLLNQFDIQFQVAVLIGDESGIGLAISKTLAQVGVSVAEPGSESIHRCGNSSKFKTRKNGSLCTYW